MKLKLSGLRGFTEVCLHIGFRSWMDGGTTRRLRNAFLLARLTDTQKNDKKISCILCLSSAIES